ncbi:MAG TPA: ATP-binding protein [Lachnospiraceae bacterium]|nr:ATP-binding protein [Lachnospiraceae bacterium]
MQNDICGKMKTAAEENATEKGAAEKKAAGAKAAGEAGGSKDPEPDSRAELKLKKKLNYMLRIFEKDYFIVLVADLMNGRVEISFRSEPVVPLLFQTLAKSNTYHEFLDFYCRQYVCEQDRAEFLKQLSPEEIRKKLAAGGTYSLSVHHMYQGRNCPTEITLIDVSDAQDGSECILMGRFIEDIVRQQTALKKQDDMVRTLVQDYNAIYHIDLDADTFMILQAHNVVNEELYDYAYRNKPFQSAMKEFVDNMVREEDRGIMLKLSSCAYMKERLAKEEGYSYRYQVTPMRGMKYFEMRIVRTRTEEAGHYAIMTVRNVDETAREELRVQRDIEKANKKLAQALETAERANESKSNFISNVSHDMRTPLNAILGYDGLALDTSSDEVRIDYLKKIGQAGETLLSLINDTLNLQKIENGVTTLHLAPVPCGTVVNGIMTTIKPLMDTKKIHFIFDNSRSVWATIVADAMRVEEIFINLLSNAAKFTPEGGEVLFSVECVRATENEICDKLIVKDNGVGISPEFISKIYEPFTQERTEKTAGIDGSGLGLAIVKRLVNLMHGRIEVTSTLGKGTEFTVYLTFPRADSKKEPEHRAKDRHAGLKGKKILLCEDNEMNREIATAILQKFGMTVISAKNGMEGVEKFKASEKGEIAAVLMDIRMPVMDGYEASRTIRGAENPDAGKIPIIALSADVYTDDIKKAQQCGMTGHLSKPIDPELLLKTLQKDIEEAG